MCPIAYRRCVRHPCRTGSWRQGAAVARSSDRTTNMPNSTPPDDPTNPGRNGQEPPERTAFSHVAYVILEAFLRARFRWPGQHSDQMNLSLTQGQLVARTTFAATEVAQALADLSQDGAILLRDDAIFVTDPDSLVDVAAVDPATIAAWLRR